MTGWQMFALACLAAMVGALPQTITAIAALIVAVRSSAKTEEIHTIVNGASILRENKAYQQGKADEQNGVQKIEPSI